MSMAWVDCVLLLVAGVWCVGVDGSPTADILKVYDSEGREGSVHASTQSPFASCPGVNSVLRLLQSALDDLRLLQEYSSEWQLLKTKHSMKVKVRAVQWARKLRRRLLRLCLQQSTFFGIPSQASGKLWDSAAGDNLLLEALHLDRPVRTPRLPRHQLSHLLDLLRSLLSRQEQTTSTTTASHISGEPKRRGHSVGLGNDIMAVEKEGDEMADEEDLEVKRNDMKVELGEITLEEEDDMKEILEGREVEGNESEEEDKEGGNADEVDEAEDEVQESGSEKIAIEDMETVVVEAEDLVGTMVFEEEIVENPSEVEDDQVEELAVEINVDEALRQVPDTFLSLALSPRLIGRGWEEFNTSSPRLLTLVSALAPAILRVGGSAANFLTYDPTPGKEMEEGGMMVEGEGWMDEEDEGEEGSGEVEEEQVEEVERTDDVQRGRCNSYQKPAFHNFTITSEEWDQLLRFTQATGMQLLFDLNQFYRLPDGETDGEGSWDPSNARLLLRDACTSGFTSVTWQLGNEPNSYKHKHGIVISGEQTARDYGSLLKVLQEECPSPSLIVGPDVTRPKHHHHPREGLGVDSMDFLESFLSTLTFNLTALTWHQYYIDGHNATETEFLDPAVMNQLEWEVAQVVQIRDQLAPGRPIWLTESGSAWGGGAPGLSDAFIAGFLWLDKLGVAAKGGVDLVARQTLYQACYSLLQPDLTPNPDYWLTLLYKRLVGGRVLRLRMPSAPPTLRLYAHCLRPHAHTEGDPQGGVVVLGMNLGTSALRVNLGDKLSASPLLQYLLQPAHGDLKARQVLLNGATLQVGPQGELPPLVPTSLPPGPFTLPSTSLGYWVLPLARAPACM